MSTREIVTNAVQDSIRQFVKDLEFSEDNMAVPLSDLGLDSLDAVEVVMNVEASLEVALGGSPVDDCEEGNSANDFINAICKTLEIE